jgi:hypothetical protein
MEIYGTHMEIYQAIYKAIWKWGIALSEKAFLKGKVAKPLIGIRYSIFRQREISSWLVISRCFLVGGLEHEFYFSIQLGMSYSQLTSSYFSEGWLNHQPGIFNMVSPLEIGWIPFQLCSKWTCENWWGF